MKMAKRKLLDEGCITSSRASPAWYPSIVHRCIVDLLQRYHRVGGGSGFPVAAAEKGPIRLRLT